MCLLFCTDISQLLLRMKDFYAWSVLVSCIWSWMTAPFAKRVSYTTFESCWAIHPPSDVFQNVARITQNGKHLHRHIDAQARLSRNPALAMPLHGDLTAVAYEVYVRRRAIKSWSQSVHFISSIGRYIPPAALSWVWRVFGVSSLLMPFYFSFNSLSEWIERVL